MVFVSGMSRRTARSGRRGVVWACSATGGVRPAATRTSGRTRNNGVRVRRADMGGIVRLVERAAAKARREESSYAEDTARTGGAGARRDEPSAVRRGVCAAALAPRLTDWTDHPTL